MLSLVMHGLVEPDRKVICDCLASLADDGFHQLKLLGQEAQPEGVLKAIAREEGLVMLFLAVAGNDQKLQEKLKLALGVQRRNRDNPLVLVLEKLRHLELFTNYTTRPSGVLAQPVDGVLAGRLIKRILRDIEAVTEPEKKNLVVKLGKKLQRLPLSRIVMIESQGKKLLIYTFQHCLTITESLKNIAEKLSDDFIQCHRAFIVNASHIQTLDLENMVVVMQNGLQASLARSARPAMIELFSTLIGSDESDGAI